MPSTELKRKSASYCGRMYVVDYGKTASDEPFVMRNSMEVLYFPSMPDSIELARTADYTVNPTMPMPDGIHQYQFTNPLVIPFSFRLHSFDKDFCRRGARSLLEISALLHSFILPQSKSGAYQSAGQVMPGSVPNGEEDSLASQAQGSDTANTVTNTELSSSPPTLRLELMLVDANSPGIVCIGYVRDVKVKLNGPWLRGPGGAYNLPTSGDFEFSFMHVPGYGLAVAFNKTLGEGYGEDDVQTQAYSGDVKSKFYNTVGLTTRTRMPTPPGQPATSPNPRLNTPPPLNPA